MRLYRIHVFFTILFSSTQIVDCEESGKICGVDEAGRGPMFGPLVIAAVAMQKERIHLLQEIGVKDSKVIERSIREKMYDQIIEVVDSYEIARIDPEEIDKSVDEYGLNNLEAVHMGDLISKLNVGTAFVDACSRNTQAFAKKVGNRAKNVRILAYHKADSRFEIVSAASIIAKVVRDRLVEEMGIIGSGYPSDPISVEYLQTYYEKHKKLPPHIRHSWEPVKEIIGHPVRIAKGQKTL